MMIRVNSIDAVSVGSIFCLVLRPNEALSNSASLALPPAASHESSAEEITRKSARSEFGCDKFEPSSARLKIDLLV